jgi:hypothetical protein
VTGKGLNSRVMFQRHCHVHLFYLSIGRGALGSHVDILVFYITRRGAKLARKLSMPPGALAEIEERRLP